MKVNTQKVSIFLHFLLGFIMWQLPAPTGISEQAWHLLIIFIITIFGIITNPLPMGSVSLISICITVVTGTLPLKDCLAGFGSDIVWLVLFAFFISLGFTKTNLGSRIAYMFIAKFGHSTLGIAYGLVLSELCLSPLIPSVTARGGGIIYPIAHSLSESYTNSDARSPSKRTGGFLMQVCIQSNVITSALFITAMAANPLIVKLAMDTSGVEITWLSWAKAAIIPGVINLMLMPLLLYFIYPPHIKHSDNAPKLATKKLEEMGPMKSGEKIMLITFVLLITLWIWGPTSEYRISAPLTALIGVSILFTAGVLNFDDAISDKAAWHTFIWFATLVMLSGYLSSLGIMSWIGDSISSSLTGIEPNKTLFILLLFYFYIHYLFASATAHATVLYPTFLMILISLNIPPMMAALLLGFLSVLSSGITHFGIASAPIFYGAGYLSTSQWWKLGFAVSILNLAIWGSFGSMWWKFLGIW